MINKPKYCPNMIYDSENISIGEFKTIEECKNYPFKGWCITRDEDNLFEKYIRNGYRLLIICSWNRNDSQRLVIALTKQGKKHKYFDLNDLPMDLIAKDYELSLGNDVLAKLQIYGKIVNENKQVIKLTKKHLRGIIRECIIKVAKEYSL